MMLERQIHLEQKDAIGRLAARYIENGDTVIFDSGTTTTAITKYMAHIKRLSVITTAVNIALTLGGEPEINILLTGGSFKFPRCRPPATRRLVSSKTCWRKNCFSPPPASRRAQG